ncbi:MAG TPA: hypothetical protein VGG34_15785 [Opitutaceae bacterium]|jgi:hypothetical protein
MEILTACLCDSAADYNGKLCILGAFDTIHVKQLPTIHPFCSVALRILLKEGDMGPHKIQMGLIDQDGRDMLPNGKISIDFKVPPLPESSFFMSSNCVLNLQGLMLPAAAQYSFDVAIDGNILVRVPMQVIKVP